MDGVMDHFFTSSLKIYFVIFDSPIFRNVQRGVVLKAVQRSMKTRSTFLATIHRRRQLTFLISRILKLP